jgi:hypothetical protein
MPGHRDPNKTEIQTAPCAKTKVLILPLSVVEVASVAGTKLAILSA